MFETQNACPNVTKQVAAIAIHASGTKGAAIATGMQHAPSSHHRLARAWQRPSCSYQASGQPAAQNVSDIPKNIGYPGELSYHREIESAFVAKVFGQPEDHEVDHGIGEEAGQNQRLAFPHGDHALPVRSGPFC